MFEIYLMTDLKIGSPYKSGVIRNSFTEAIGKLQTQLTGIKPITKHGKIETNE